MTNALKKSEKIELEINASDKKLVEMAAALSGQTMSDFLMEPVLANARRVLQGQTSITLKNELFDSFFTTCDFIEKQNLASNDSLQNSRKTGTG